MLCSLHHSIGCNNYTTPNETLFNSGFVRAAPFLLNRNTSFERLLLHLPIVVLNLTNKSNPHPVRGKIFFPAPFGSVDSICNFTVVLIMFLVLFSTAQNLTRQPSSLTLTAFIIFSSLRYTVPLRLYDLAVARKEHSRSNALRTFRPANQGRSRSRPTLLVLSPVVFPAAVADKQKTLFTPKDPVPVFPRA